MTALPDRNLTAKSDLSTNSILNIFDVVVLANIFLCLCDLVKLGNLTFLHPNLVTFGFKKLNMTMAKILKMRL